MEIGKLNKRIIFQEFTSIINDNGFNEDTWTDKNTVWASATNLSGREYFAAAAVQAENTVKFTIRYIEDISTDMRISFQNNIYNITFIDNIKYGNEFMEIKTMAVV